MIEIIIMMQRCKISLHQPVGPLSLTPDKLKGKLKSPLVKRKEIYKRHYVNEVNDPSQYCYLSRGQKRENNTCYELSDSIKHRRRFEI